MVFLAAAPAVNRDFWGWVASILQNNWQLFLRGAGVTLLIALVGTVVGFIIGLFLGVVRTIPVDAKSSSLKKILLKIVNIIISVYITVFRGTPMIVQAMVIYYGVASTGIRLDPILAGLFIVSINTGAYMAEIMRGGIMSIDRGQFEAAHSIGMTHRQTMMSIVLPQAIRNILPATGNEFIINIKDTSVLNVISVSELFFQTKSVAGNNFRTFEAFFITCIIYLIMTYGIARILRLVEKKLAGSNVYTIHGSQTTPESEIKIVDKEKTDGKHY